MTQAVGNPLKSLYLLQHVIQRLTRACSNHNFPYIDISGLSSRPPCSVLDVFSFLIFEYSVPQLTLIPVHSTAHVMVPTATTDV